MLSYLSTGGQKTHIVDELTRGNGLGPGKTLCGREIQGGTVTESSRLPGCTRCARILRRGKFLAARADPLKGAPMPLADTRDLLCPICREPMRLAAKRHSFPTHRVNAVRVTMMLICDNADGHGENP